MSQNNDWLAYEKSGSCRTDSLMHASWYGSPKNPNHKPHQASHEKLDAARQKLEAHRKNDPNVVGKLQNATNKLLVKQAISFVNTLISTIESCINEANTARTNLETAYSVGSKKSFVDNLGKYYNAKKKIEIAYNDNVIPGTTYNMKNFEKWVDMASSAIQEAQNTKEIRDLIRKTEKVDKKVQDVVIPAETLINMKRKFGLT